MLYITNNSIKHQSFVYTWLNDQTVQFSIKSFVCTQLKCQTFLFDPYAGATILGQSEPVSNGNKGVLCIPQSSNITEVSISDCLVSYLGHSLGKSYSFAEIQSVYSAAPANWAKDRVGILYFTTILRQEGLFGFKINI